MVDRREIDFVFGLVLLRLLDNHNPAEALRLAMALRAELEAAPK